MSLQVLTDFVYELEHAAAITAIVSTRIFYRNPADEQTATNPYLVYTKTMQRDMVRESYFFQIAAFSDDLTELENLTNAIIEHFEDRRVMGASSNEYFSISLVNVTDGREKLKSGHWFNIIMLEVKGVT